MPKGKKTCEKCGHECGPRAYMCPECQHPFMFAPKSKEKRTTRMIRKFDWRELKKGDRIVTTGGIFGKINNISDNVITIDAGNNVLLKVDKSAILKDPSDISAQK